MCRLCYKSFAALLDSLFIDYFMARREGYACIRRYRDGLKINYRPCQSVEYLLAVALLSISRPAPCHWKSRFLCFIVRLKIPAGCMTARDSPVLFMCSTTAFTHPLNANPQKRNPHSICILSVLIKIIYS